MVFYHVKFTAHDRFDVVFAGGSHKIKYSKHIPVVGYGHGGHVIGGGFFEEFVDVGGTIKQ
jgi:hypothetical protein